MPVMTAATGLATGFASLVAIRLLFGIGESGAFPFPKSVYAVRDALATLEADRPLVIPGFAMKLLMLLARLMPLPILRWVARMSPRKRGVV